MSPFQRPVSAAKNSVPGTSARDWFDMTARRVGSLVPSVSTTQSVGTELVHARVHLSPPQCGLLGLRCGLCTVFTTTKSWFFAVRLRIETFRSWESGRPVRRLGAGTQFRFLTLDFLPKVCLAGQRWR